MNKDIQKHITNRLDFMYQGTAANGYIYTEQGFKRRIQAKDRLARQLGFIHYFSSSSYFLSYWRL